MLLVAEILIPVVWVVLAHWSGVPLGSESNLGALLATIGGVMGAIFTAGGLIIALVSVYTQLSIEGRIRSSFEALQPELDERSRLQIEAYLALTRALEQGDWRQVQSFGSEALAKWPALQGLRSAIGERLSDDVATWFYYNKLEISQKYPVRPGGLPMVLPAALPSVSYQADPLSFGQPPLIVQEAEEEVPKLEAIAWLRDAIGHREEIDGTLHARLACMYGVCGRFGDMIENVRKAKALNGEIATYLTQPTRMAMLAYACRDSQTMNDRLGKLGEELSLALPASSEKVLESLEHFVGSEFRTPWLVGWIAIKKPGHEARPAPQSTLSALHITLGDATGTRSGWASWMPFNTENLVIPGPGASFIPIGDLVPQLSEMFVFICQQ